MLVPQLQTPLYFHAAAGRLRRVAQPSLFAPAFAASPTSGLASRRPNLRPPANKPRRIPSYAIEVVSCVRTVRNRHTKR